MDFPSGRPGDPAVSLVEKASRRGAVCATTLFQPMVGSLVQGQIPKCEAVSISCVQWMAAGQSGALGKNAQGAVDAAIEPGPELAIIHQLSMAGGHAKGVPWE